MNKLSKIRNNESKAHNEEVEREMMGMVARHNINRAKAVEFSKQGRHHLLSEKKIQIKRDNQILLSKLLDISAGKNVRQPKS